MQSGTPKGKDDYIEITTGFTCGKVKDIVLDINNIIYGQAEAPRLWYGYLKKGIEEKGSKMSGRYTCIFITNKVIWVSYVDDCLFWDRYQGDNEEVLNAFEDNRPKYRWEFSKGENVS